MLEIEHMLGKCSTTELHPQPVLSYLEEIEGGL
jgi:hypothetical protein